MSPTTALMLTSLMSSFLLVVPVGHAADGGEPSVDLKAGGTDSDSKRLFQEGRDLLDAGECRLASRHFKSILKLEPDHPEANYFRGSALVCQGHHRIATKFLLRAIKFDRLMYLAYAQLGHTYLELKKFEQAERQLDELNRMRSECGNDCPSKLLSAIEELRLAIRPEANETRDESERAPKGRE